jgi:CRISPR-associated protein Csx10
MKAVTYQITLLEPLLATTLGGDPNSAITHPYIPGSMIRGLLAKLYNAETTDLTGDEATRPLLFDGAVRYLNAYPSLDGVTRTLPVPASWQSPKLPTTKAITIRDFALCTADELHAWTHGPEGERIPYKGVGGFVTPEGLAVTPYMPKRHVAIHTLRNRFAGRPDERDGAVYRYEALAAGQVFSGAIVAPEDGNGQAFCQRIVAKLTDLQVHLGGSHTAGYGLVQFSAVTTCDHWYEATPELQAASPDHTYVITLLSDTILRDQYGQTHTDLAQALRLVWPDCPPAMIQCPQATLNLTVAGGFNRAWGLPLSQTQALKAGSLYLLHLPVPDAVARLNQLSATGIGERRVDGFGRIAVNWQNSTRKSLQSVEPDTPFAPPPARPQLSALSAVMAMRMATRRRRHALDRRLAIAVLQLGKELGDPLPSKTQLARVRTIARDALKYRDLARIATLFTPLLQDEGRGEAVKNPDAFEKPALDQFRRARLGQTRLHLWIKGLLADPHQVWQHFQGHDERKAIINSEPEGWMAEEYAIRLIDGVLAQASERQQREGA